MYNESIHHILWKHMPMHGWSWSSHGQCWFHQSDAGNTFADPLYGNTACFLRIREADGSTVSISTETELIQYLELPIFNHGVSEEYNT